MHERQVYAEAWLAFLELEKLVCVGLFGNRHLNAAHTVPNAYQRARHLIAEVVDHI